MLFIQAPYGRVIRAIQPHDEFGGRVSVEYCLNWTQDLLQRFCAKLGRSTCAGGHAGEADFLSAHAAWF